MSIIANFNDWKKYLLAVGDTNPIHSDLEVARENDLSKRVAPGMWVASFAKEYSWDAKCIEIKFKNTIFEGDEVSRVTKEGNTIFYKNSEENPSCIVQEINQQESLEVKEDFRLTREVTKESVNNYLESINAQSKEFPLFYLISLSAPAVVEYGKNAGIKTGFHLYQSFAPLSAPSLEGKVEVLIGNSKRREYEGKGSLISMDMIWLQDNKKIGYGKSKVLAMKQI